VSTSNEHESTVTLDQAEQWMRYVASRPDGHDTGAAFRVMVAEYDRRGAELERLRADEPEVCPKHQVPDANGEPIATPVLGCTPCARWIAAGRGW
jgi:hypothetical protein